VQANGSHRSAPTKASAEVPVSRANWAARSPGASSCPPSNWYLQGHGIRQARAKTRPQSAGRRRHQRARWPRAWPYERSGHRRHHRTGGGIETVLHYSCRDRNLLACNRICWVPEAGLRNVLAVTALIPQAWLSNVEST